MAWLSLAALLTAGGSFAQDLASDGLIWLDADRYTYPALHAQGDLVVDGPMTWEYIGQAIFDLEAGTAEPSWTLAGEGTLAGLLGTTRVDQDGARWVVVDVDQDLLAAKTAAYEQWVAETFPDGEERRGPETKEPEPELVWPHFVGWQEDIFYYTVDSGNTVGIGGSVDRWDTDDRNRKDTFSEWTENMKTQVFILRNGIARCSGTHVGEERILTAAHCITGPQGNELDPNTFTVCTFGNSYYNATQCVDVTDVVKNPNWPGIANGGDPEDDFGIIKLGGTLNVPIMPLSWASDETLNACSVHNGGYGSILPGLLESLYDTGQFAAYWQADFTHMISEVIGTPIGLVKTRIDTVEGLSGSGMWYCPTTCAESSAFLISVTSGHFTPFGSSAYTGGPKIPDPNTHVWIDGFI